MTSWHAVRPCFERADTDVAQLLRDNPGNRSIKTSLVARFYISLPQEQGKMNYAHITKHYGTNHQQSSQDKSHQPPEQ